MKTKFSHGLEQAANDPGLRRMAMVDFMRQRGFLLVCAMTLTLAALVMRFTPTRSPHSTELAGLAAVLLWVLVGRVESHLRELALLDQAVRVPAGKRAR